MTTDYTSALINKNIKTAATENRTFSTVSGTTEAGAFDAVFENVSKTYTDKSEMKKSVVSKEKNNYASKTKDVQSAKKSNVKAQNNNAKETKTLNNATISNDNKLNTKTEYNKQTENIKKDKLNSFEGSTQKAETINTNKEVVKSSAINEQQVLDSVQNIDNFNQESVSAVFSEANENVEFEQNDNTEVSSDSEGLFNKNETDLSAPQITNEQLFANITYEQNAVLVQKDSVQSEISEFFDSENQILSFTKSSTNENVLQTMVDEKLVETSAKELFNNINTSFSSDASMNNIAKEVAANIAIQELEIQQKASNDTFLTAMNEDFLIADDNLSVDITNLNRQDLEKEIISQNKMSPDVFEQNIRQNTEKTATQRTVQENLASDNSRFTVNLSVDNDNENLDEYKVITPNQTNNEAVSDENVPVIKVTDKVAQQAVHEFSNLVENRDFAGKVKDKATAKLGELEGTSTVITDVKNSHIQNQSANSQGQGSLTQGNATEQAIKMSIENISTESTSADSFIAQLESKLNANVKVSNVKQPEVLNKSDIMSQLDAKFNEMQQNGQNKVSIILRPENLGRVSVEIMNSKDGIIAKMMTDNQQVRELLDKNIESLRASLSSQGVNVNNIKVECSNQSENNAMDFERHQFEQNSQDFQDSNNSNHHAGNSNKNSETAFWDSLKTTEESEESTEVIGENITTEKVITNETTITHNGKIDYKV